MRPQLSVKYCEITKLFAHIPEQPRLELRARLKHLFENIDQLMDYVPPVPTTGEQQ